MTDEQKIQALWECIQRDGDETAAEAFCALRQRAEQAEREREETLRMWREYKAAKDADVASADGARERAEADNAALLEGIRKAVRHLREDGSPRECWCGAEEGTNVEEHDSTCAAQFLEPRVGGPLMGGDHPGAALLERLRALERFTSAARDLEWQRHDWQGLCVFRRAAGCDGTDGRYSALGTPKPRPHSENCPFHGLNALEKAP